MNSALPLLAPARIRRAAAVVLSLAMAALLLVVPGTLAMAADPLVFTFKRTSPPTLQAGQPALFEFTASKPVNRVTVEISFWTGERRTASAEWKSQAPSTSGSVALDTPVDTWPNGPVQIQNIGVGVHNGDPVSFRRDGSFIGPAVALGPFHEEDVYIENPALPREAPVFTALKEPIAPVEPGQSAAVKFSLGLPAQRVELDYLDESGITGMSLTWTGPTSAQPASGVATAPITSSTFHGRYALNKATVTYLGGTNIVYHRNGSYDGVMMPSPGNRAPLEDGDFSVQNLQAILRPVAFPSGVKIATDYGLETVPVADVGGMSPPNARLEYQWFIDGAPVEGATSKSLDATIGGKVLTVRVTAHAEGHVPTTVTSDPIGPMPRRLNTHFMWVTGNAVLGGQVYPTWAGPPWVSPEGGTPAYTYVWKRDGVVIPGATNAIRTVTAADMGHTLTVELNIMYEPLTQKTLTADVPIPHTQRSLGFNADGTADIFARTASGDLLLYPGNGKGGWLPAQTIGRGWDIFDTLLAPGDFDGDGATDVIGRDRSGKLFLYSGNGSGAWKGSRQIGQGWQGFKEIVAPGDFNRDGAHDLLARDSSDRLILYPGDGHGGWKAPVTVGWGWGGYSRLIAPGWWTGYHEANILGQTTSGELKLYAGINTGFFDFRTTVGSGWNSVVTVGGPGDFNGDGSPDVFGVDAKGTMTMYWGNGTGINGCGLDCGYWKGQTVVGWGWGGFSAIF
ncbi:FG-GAP-like repeat-containing protein [Paenarthrobacter sp. NPDC089322]|uniref:FG-GAP repeat domain-containing protein n=1 Tax=Paenarthrobacter sp. NPDC089322 TaxID=3155065 RepID=UPI00343F9501